MGDEVRYSDQVKFESVVTEGQFLHCSKKTFGDVKIKANKKWYVMCEASIIQNKVAELFCLLPFCCL